MTLLLRTLRRQEEIESRPHIIDWQPDDYAVVDDKAVVGRIRREKLPAGAKWCWFLQTAPIAPPPNSGSAATLAEAKAEFRARYEAVQVQWRRS
jgi:hypothetical protein